MSAPAAPPPGYSPVYLLVDLFPAVVTITGPDGGRRTHRRVRAVLASPLRRVSALDRGPHPLDLLVYADLAPPGLVAAARAAVPDPLPPRAPGRSADVLLQLSDGSTAGIAADGGCGCGSRLRSLQLFPSSGRALP